MEGLREFKNYTLLDNISSEGLEFLLKEYTQLNIGDETTTLNLRYTNIASNDNWTILEWNSDENLTDDIFFYLHQNITSWLEGSHSTKASNKAFALAFEEDAPMQPIFFGHTDPENGDRDTSVGIYEDEHYSYYLPSGELEMGDEVDLKFNIADFLLDEFNFELDWLVDADSFEWNDFPITLEYDNF